MQLDEFIQATGRLETYYDKELKTEQIQIMYEELKNISIDRYVKLISKCIRKCRTMPRISDILEANMELVGEINEDENKQIIPCNKCDGSGYVIFTKFIANGNERIPYSYAARCVCENGKNANQKVPTYEELGIKIGNRINQIRDTTRSIEQIKKDLLKKF